jgi:hypothetical protein
MKAVFSIEGSVARTSALAGGPWNPELQHGSAPASLVSWIAEQVPTASPMNAARLTLDLMRPLPIAPLEFKTEILREGRKIQLVGVTLFAGGNEVVRASILKMRVDIRPSCWRLAKRLLMCRFQKSSPQSTMNLSAAAHSFPAWS